MADLVPAQEATLAVVKYDVTEAQIAEARERLSALVTCTTPAEHRAIAKGIAECRDTRVGVESQRKDLKRDALEYGRRVDARAKHLTALVEAIEQPLRQLKAQYDEEREQEKIAVELAEREALEKQIRQAREAEEARLRAIREAEEQRLADERARLERERLEREWLAFVGFLVMIGANAESDELRRREREQAAAESKARQEQADKEREALEAEDRRRREAEAQELAREKAAVEAERERVRSDAAKAAAEAAAAEAARAAATETEKRLAWERAEAEEAARQEAERKLAHERRMAALQPDRVKLAAYATALHKVEKPAVVEPEAVAALETAARLLSDAIAALDAMGESWEREQVESEGDEYP